MIRLLDTATLIVALPTFVAPLDPAPLLSREHQRGLIDHFFWKLQHKRLRVCGCSLASSSAQIIFSILLSFTFRQSKDGLSAMAAEAQHERLRTSRTELDPGN